jgi:hypothetical protein
MSPFFPMPTVKLPLTIRLTEAQLGYLEYRYPGADPEEAIALLVERDRTRSLRRADERVEVLRFDEVCSPPEPENILPAESDNPIGTIQEYCQQRQLPLPSYSFTPVNEGFCCTVEGLGLTACAIAVAKKKAKAEAAGVLLKMVGSGEFIPSTV